MMVEYRSEDIRNIALLGHAGSGKTELTEALLFEAGAITSRGSIERGTTVSDYDPQEKRLGHSLDSSICHLDYQGTHINLIDTPGYPDLIGRALSILPGVETAAVVINAQTGIEMVARLAMEAAAERGDCRLIIVNKIDAADVNLEALLVSIREAFGDECLPLNLPANGGQAVIDCFFNVREQVTDFLSVTKAHTEIIDQVVEVDEKLMEIYLEQGEELEPEQLHDSFEEALRQGHLIPVCFVSARSGAGIPQLLSVFTKLMPNPLEGNPPPFLKGEGEQAQPVEVVPDPERHIVAHVFKVSVDPFVGKMGIFRIYQGTVTNNSQLYIGDGRKPFKAAHILKIQGKNHIEAGKGIPGDICAVAKVDEIHLDAVLHDSHDEDYFHLIVPKTNPPMMGLALEPVRRGDEQKLSEALHKLAAEDPSLRVEHNPAVNETVIRGMGELHLRVILERMQDAYHVEVHTHAPSIAYRETILAPAEGHHRHKKQSGGAGQFGEVFLRIAPLERGSGFEFLNKVVGGAIPSQFIPAVEKGVRQIIESGAIAGFPIQDIQVTVYDGKYHAVDSKEVAFVAAGKKALLDAITKARPVVLEPIVDIHIDTPIANVGDVTGDISSKGGRINGTEAGASGRVRISGQVRLSALDNYQPTLKSITGGQGTYTIHFSHYETAPGNVQKDLTSAFKIHSDD
ncbi:MAG: elongation factor G [Methylococcaceae bacterium]|nr:elongation factor G [Methylococcaceae bacterium]